MFELEKELNIVKRANDAVGKEKEQVLKKSANMVFYETSKNIFIFFLVKRNGLITIETGRRNGA